MGSTLEKIRNRDGGIVYVQGLLPNGEIGIVSDEVRPFTDEELNDAAKFNEHMEDLNRRISETKQVFDPSYEPPRPSQVIFSILERAVREGSVGMDNGQMWRKPETVDADIDDYIGRLLKNKPNDPA